MIGLNLAEETRRLLLDRPRRLTYEIIGEATGLNPRWLSHFAGDAEQKSDPGAGKVQALYEYLTGRSLL